MFKKTCAITTMITLTSCSLFFEPMPKTWGWGVKPRPTTGVRNFPPADTEYGKGFKDGCASGWDAAGKGIISDFNYKRYDYQRMKQGPDYQSGWWDGFEQCTYILDHDVV